MLVGGRLPLPDIAGDPMGGRMDGLATQTMDRIATIWR